eukprot:148963_1
MAGHQFNVQAQKQQLQSHMSKTTAVDNLLSAMQHFSLGEIKTFVNNQIETLGANQTTTVYYNLLSINTTLSDDVLQRVLSFSDLYSPRSVCKKWQTLSIQNETNYMTQIYASANIEIRKDNDTWVVHPKRPCLHQVEKDLGLKGPINTFPWANTDDYEWECTEHLERMINSCNDGDTLLFHDGRYWKWAGFKFNKTLNFIGIGNDVCFRKESEDAGSSLIQVHGPSKCNVYFENIIFDSAKELYSKKDRKCICVGSKNSVRLKNCKLITSGIGIEICNESNLTVTDSHFYSHGIDTYVSGSNDLMASGTHAICVPETAGDVNIERCLFKKFSYDFYKERGGCILIIRNKDEKSTVMLKCTGNTFDDINNKCHPLVEFYNFYRTNQSSEDHLSHEYEIRDNVLKGKNIVNNPNKIHQTYKIHQQEYFEYDNDYEDSCHSNIYPFF